MGELLAHRLACWKPQAHARGRQGNHIGPCFHSDNTEADTPKLNLYEKEKQFLVEPKSQEKKKGLSEIQWQLKLLLRKHAALSSRDLRVTDSKMCALCTAQMSFCGIALSLVG